MGGGGRSGRSRAPRRGTPPGRCPPPPRRRAPRGRRPGRRAATRAGTAPRAPPPSRAARRARAAARGGARPGSARASTAGLGAAGTNAAGESPVIATAELLTHSTGVDTAARREEVPARVGPVPWEESHSPTFSARHDSSQRTEAAAVLESLEAFRGEVDGLFDRAPTEIAVVLHPRAAALTLAHPWLPLARLVAAPASRRYFAGWFTEADIHVLSPPALERRASKVPGSREALLLSPLHEYSHLVIGANNPDLPPPFSPAAFRRYVRWAWLCEGGAVWLSGQTPVPAARHRPPTPRGRPPRVPAHSARRHAPRWHDLQHARARGGAGRRRRAHHQIAGGARCPRTSGGGVRSPAREHRARLARRARLAIRVLIRKSAPRRLGAALCLPWRSASSARAISIVADSSRSHWATPAVAAVPSPSRRSATSARRSPRARGW